MRNPILTVVLRLLFTPNPNEEKLCIQQEGQYIITNYHLPPMYRSDLRIEIVVSDILEELTL